jgi:type II secretory pathway component PulF
MRSRRVFYEGLASLLDAGIPVRAAMAQLAAQSSGPLGEALRHLGEAVDGGRTLADGMEERPGFFRRFEVEMVRAGELSGTLDRAARALAADVEASDRVRRKVLSTLLYPAFVYHFAAIPFNIVGGWSRSFLVGCLLWILPFWILAGLAWWLLRQARRGGPAARAVLAVPFIGWMLRDAALLRWARTFAALEDAGVLPEPCALRAAAATGLASLERPLAFPAVLLRAGATRTAAFAGTPLPPEMYAALAQGETAGSIAPLLRKAADVHESRLSTRTESALKMLPAVATILAGAVVLYVAMHVVGGYYGMAK